MTARVVPVNERDEVLLLCGFDPARPDDPYWVSIGGARESGEDLTAAAVRELYEETGLVVGEHEVGAPFHESVSEFTYNGVRYANHCTYFAVRISSAATIVFDHMGDSERRGTVKAGWHRPEAVAQLPLSNEGLPHIAERAVASVRPAAGPQ